MEYGVFVRKQAGQCLRTNEVALSMQIKWRVKSTSGKLAFRLSGTLWGRRGKNSAPCLAILSKDLPKGMDLKVWERGGI